MSLMKVQPTHKKHNAQKQMAKKKIVKQLSQAQLLAQEMINKEIKLPREVAKVSIVFHRQSTTNKPYRNLVKYRLTSLTGANPHVVFQKLAVQTQSNDNFVTLEMIDGTQRKVGLPSKETDTDKITAHLLRNAQELVPAVDVRLARFLQNYGDRIQASSASAGRTD
jgi:hypothetical protein